MELVLAFHEKREPIQTNGQEEQYARIMKKQFAMGQRAFLGGMWVKEIVNKQEDGSQQKNEQHRQSYKYRE